MTEMRFFKNYVHTALSGKCHLVYSFNCMEAVTHQTTTRKGVRETISGVAERGCYFLLLSATFCYFLLFWACGFFGAAGGGAILCYFLLFSAILGSSATPISDTLLFLFFCVQIQPARFVRSF